MRTFALSKVKRFKTNKIMEQSTNITDFNTEYPTSSTLVNNTLLAQVVCETMLNKYKNRFFYELMRHDCITPTVKDINVIGANKVEVIFNDGEKLTETIHQFYKGAMTYENIYTMRQQRRGHKLDEWRIDFFNWSDELPHLKELFD